MNRSETATLLGLCAAYDRRTTGEADVLAWTDILGDLRLEDCILAVKAWYTKSSTFIMPSDIRDAVRVLRVARIEAAGHLTPPQQLADDPVRELAWRRAATKAVADGDPIPASYDPTLRQRRMPALDNVFRTIPEDVVA